MIQKEKLNKYVRENIDRYLNLDISNQKISCPYAINFVEQEFLSLMKQSGIDEERIKEVHKLYKGNKSKYGWYRGKGTPEELKSAFLEISKVRDFNIQNASPDGIRESMKLFGLGIDCSGYIYNVLLEGFKSINMEDQFIKSLAWQEEDRTGASRASVEIFSGTASTIITDLDSLSNLDLLLLKNKEGSYTHMAMVLKDGDQLKITQSVFSIIPNGVRIDNMRVEENIPRFEFKVDIGTDWNILYTNNRIEFRRLNILVDDTKVHRT
ncbi:MAG: hypothetical protein PHE21_00420 [Candidatus Dojkabacteria bacterium]|nr:hypothetical protein [Candidatus Dojkabacteria bacterium]